MPYRTFSDETEEASAEPEPEYSFAGYNVEFSEKIALTPPAGPQRENGESAASGPSAT